MREAALALGDANPVGHHVTNIVITWIDDRSARVQSKGIGIKADGTAGSVAYDDIVARQLGGWKISYRKVTAKRAALGEEEAGAREVLERLRQAAISQSADDMRRVYAVDAVHEFPFTRPGVPSRLEGRDEIVNWIAAGWKASPLKYERYRTLAIYDTNDPETIIVEQEGSSRHQRIHRRVRASQHRCAHCAQRADRPSARLRQHPGSRSRHGTRSVNAPPHPSPSSNPATPRTWPGNPLNRDGAMAGAENLAAQIGQVVANALPRSTASAPDPSTWCARSSTWPTFTAVATPCSASPNSAPRTADRDRPDRRPDRLTHSPGRRSGAEHTAPPTITPMITIYGWSTRMSARS